MKLSILLLFINFIHISATVYSQNERFTFKENKIQIRDLLDKIESKSKFRFLYRSEYLNSLIIDVDARNLSLDELLSAAFNKTDITYKVLEDNLVVIAPKEFASAIQQQKITGTVIDASTGEPLPGVSILIDGTSQGVITDINGKYSIDVPNENAVLVFSYIGYLPEKYTVSGQTNIDVKLVSDVRNLEEVVVVGYGTQKKINLTGSVSAISSSDLVKRPANNVGNLLQGKISGLQVVQSSGEPGNDNALIRIRGIGTLSGAGNDPLVLIDGVQGNLAMINSENIESISVLKDAASASIYGSRAANGVILVTTKQGKTGALVIEYSGNYQVQEPTRMPKFVTNSADFMSDWNAANQRGGLPNYFTQAEIDAFRNSTDPIKYPNFNWVKHMIGNGTEQKHYLSMNGGNEKTTFTASLGYLDQTGLNSAFNYEKYDMMFNLNSKLNKVVSFGTNISLHYTERNEPVMGSTEFMLLVYTAGPNYLPKLSDGSGRWTWRYNNAAWHNRNPEQALSYGNKLHNIYSLAAQAYMDFNLAKDLVFEVKGAVNYDGQFNKDNEHAVPSYFYSDNSLAALATGYNVGVTNNFNQNILTTIYSTLNYRKSFAGHNFSALLGYSQESNTYRYLQGYRQTFPTDALTELNAGSTLNQTLSGSSNEWALQSLFGRINYDFRGKYLLEGNFRYDGSSRIYKANRWGLFPSVSTGWRVSEEDFMKSISWIDNLKLRASWGVLGNQNIGLYPYQDILNTNSYAFSSSVTQGAAVTRLVDKTLKWESTKIKDLGFDFSIKNGLFSITADWFNKETDDILYAIDIPASIGLASPTVNYAKMKNNGFECEIGHASKIGDLRYNVSFNLSAFKNEVLKIKAPTYGSTTTIQEGLPWNSYYLTEWVGIFQSQDEINNSPKQPFNPKPGDLKFKDQNGDNVIDSKDRVVVDGAYPKFYYGGTLNLSWKNFELSAFLQGVQGQKFYVNGWGIEPFIQGSAPTEEFAKNAWTPENKSNTDPAMYYSGYGPVTGTRSTYFLKDASYFRLKNLLIGYNLPSRICQSLKMKNLRIYLSGDNLATITNYPGADPERTGSGLFQTYPQLRIYTIGLNVKF